MSSQDVFLCVRVRVRVGACARARACARVRACVRACVRVPARFPESKDSEKRGGGGHRVGASSRRDWPSPPPDRNAPVAALRRQ